MASSNEEFYRKLRDEFRNWLKTEEGKTNRWGELLMLAPDFFYLLWKLSLDKEVSIKHKAKLAGAIAYFISPIDLIPEAIFGPFGYLDDLALAAYVLNGIINDTNPEVVEKYWVGDADLLQMIEKLLKSADEMIGSGLWKKLKAKLSS